MKIIGLMAADPNGVIGKDGKLPWNLPEDLVFFRQIILDATVIMGRKTFESISQTTLQLCYPIVFSQNKREKPFISSLEGFFDLLLPEKVYMIGGGSLAKLFLSNNLVDEFILTKVRREYEGDTYLNLHTFEHWPATLVQESSQFSIYRFVRSL